MHYINLKNLQTTNSSSPRPSLGSCREVWECFLSNYPGEQGWQGRPVVLGMWGLIPFLVLLLPAVQVLLSVSNWRLWKWFQGQVWTWNNDEYGMSSAKSRGPGHPLLACNVAASALFWMLTEYSAQQRQTCLSKVLHTVLGESPKQQPRQGVQMYLGDIPQAEALDFTSGFFQSLLLLFST